MCIGNSNVSGAESRAQPVRPLCITTFQGSKKELKSFDGKGARPFQLFKSVSAKLLILFGHARSGEMENLPIALIALIAFIAFLLEPTISA